MKHSIAVKLARLDEQLKALAREIARTELSGKEALGISNTEQARRLEILNGEAGRLREMQQTYVLREVFDRYKEMIDGRAEERNRTVEVRLKALEGVNSVASGQQAASTGHREAVRWLIGVLVALFVAALGYMVTR